MCFGTFCQNLDVFKRQNTQTNQEFLNLTRPNSEAKQKVSEITDNILLYLSLDLNVFFSYRYILYIKYIQYSFMFE